LDIDTTILPDICKIMNFYSLTSSLCPNADVKIVTTPVAAANTGTTRRKILLWIVGIAAGIFALLIGIFAIRAKIKQANEEEDVVPETPTVTQPTPPVS